MRPNFLASHAGVSALLVLMSMAVVYPLSGVRTQTTDQDKPDRPPWAQKSKPRAASGKGQPAPADGGQAAEDNAQQRGRIRVNVNLVNVLVSVLDEHNRPAPDLPREAFQLFEEGAEQKIDKFEPETSQPLDLAIMIDSSMSAHKEITFEQDAAAHFIRQ